MRTIPRRIVTGTRDNRSVIESDQVVANVSEDIPGLIISDLWNTGESPASLSWEKPIPNTAMPNTPTRGTYFRYVQIPPDKDINISPKQGQPHPLMHQTATLDYIVILSGEVYLVLDDQETLLKPGDIVIQRGTNHAWSNRSEQACIQLAVLIGTGAV